MSTGELVGTIGVSLLLIAFALNLIGKISSTSKAYLIMNIGDAALACVSIYLIQFWTFVVLRAFRQFYL